MAPDVNLNRPFDPRLFLMDQELDRGVGLLLAGASELTRAAEKARRKASGDDNLPEDRGGMSGR